MNPKIPVTLNIAGELIEVLFDGVSVYEPLFPDEKIVSISAKCGMVVDQEILVKCCQRKLEQSSSVIED